MYGVVYIPMFFALILFQPTIAACGSWWNDLLIPDRFPVLSPCENRTADFASSCKEHDQCYRICGVDNKEQCDRIFYRVSLIKGSLNWTACYSIRKTKLNRISSVSGLSFEFPFLGRSRGQARQNRKV